MRGAPPPLKEFLDSHQIWWSADLFTVSLVNGTILRYNSTDIPISYGGITWLATMSSQGPTITRTSWKMTNTTDVPDMEILINSTGDDYNGTNIKKLIHNGYFDGALFELSRAVMPSSGAAYLGAPLMFSGKVSTTEISGLGIKLTVKSLSTLLQQFMPRNIYTAGCSWALYSSGCGVSRAAFTATNTVSTGPSNKIVLSVAGGWTRPGPITPPVGQLILGTLTITSGAGQGQSRTIVAASATQIQLGYPLYTVPASGDTLSAVLGCNKTRANCATPFNNINNYRGFDFIPPAETAY